MKFLLDTDTCIDALKQKLPVLKNLLARAPEDIAVSVITEAELRTGAAKSSSAAKTLRLVENFLRPIAILEFTSSDAASYAQVRVRLERAGTPIGPLDTLIAARLSFANWCLFPIISANLAELRACIFRTGQISTRLPANS